MPAHQSTSSYLQTLHALMPICRLVCRHEGMSASRLVCRHIGMSTYHIGMSIGVQAYRHECGMSAWLVCRHIGMSASTSSYLQTLHTTADRPLIPICLHTTLRHPVMTCSIHTHVFYIMYYDMCVCCDRTLLQKRPIKERCLRGKDTRSGLYVCVLW